MTRKETKRAEFASGSFNAVNSVKISVPTIPPEDYDPQDTWFTGNPFGTVVLFLGPLVEGLRNPNTPTATLREMGRNAAYVIEQWATEGYAPPEDVLTKG